MKATFHFSENFFAREDYHACYYDRAETCADRACEYLMYKTERKQYYWYETYQGQEEGIVQKSLVSAYNRAGYNTESEHGYHDDKRQGKVEQPIGISHYIVEYDLSKPQYQRYHDYLPESFYPCAVIAHDRVSHRQKTVQQHRAYHEEPFGGLVKSEIYRERGDEYHKACR